MQYQERFLLRIINMSESQKNSTGMGGGHFFAFPQGTSGK